MGENMYVEYKCIRKKEGGNNCNGKLKREKSLLKCQKCGKRYTLVDEVPVFNEGLFEENGPTEDMGSWYENVYESRSRKEELKTSYLGEARIQIENLVSKYEIDGPSLEIGCGVGLFADKVPRFVGLEYALQSLFAEGFDGYQRVCADARDMPFPDDSFELIFSFNTIEHISEPDRVYTEIDRLLKPGGLLVLKPAWHCTWYNTKLIPVKKYSELSTTNKIVKLMLPLIQSRVYKALKFVPWRIWRHFSASQPSNFEWTSLDPTFDVREVADADAVASIDIHETILFFSSRGYKCTSHPSKISQIMAGHDVLVLYK
jgi:SAM-dependent methyltransferase